MSKFVAVQLDKSRNLRYGMEAIDNVEEMLGIAINKLDMEELTMRQAATLIWAGLVHEDNSLTVKQVMKLIDEYGDLQDVLQKMTDALDKGFTGKFVAPTTI
jgi:L-fucose isomerase-like protein